MPKDSFGPVRERFSLEGFWDFFKDSEDICRSPEDLVKVEKWDRLYVPANWNEQDSDLMWYYGAGWYRRKFFIPEDWEGKYRISEQGNTANFYYIGDPKSKDLLFSINYFNESDWNSKKNNLNSNEKKVIQEGIFAYTYILSTNSRSSAEDYKIMVRDIEDIIQSLK